MKKYFFVFAACAICGVASAQTAFIGDIDVKPGERATFTIYVNVGNNEFTGIEFKNMSLPEGLSIDVSDEPAYEPCTVNTNWDATAFAGIGFDTSNNTYVGSFTSQKDISIPKNQDFAIGSVKLEASSDLSTDVPLSVTIPGGCLKFVPGSIPVEEDITFTVNVSNYITLDENSLAIPEKKTAADVNVKVNRSFNANEWSTICFPLTKMTHGKMKSIFGENYELASLSKSTTEKDDEGKVTGISIEFTSAITSTTTDATNIIQNSRPYIIKPSQEVKDYFTVEGVRINPNEANVKTAITELVYDEDLGDDVDVEIASMTGTLKAGTVVPNGSLFINNNKFWYSVGKTKMKAFRAYFTFQDKLEGFNGDNVRFFVSDGVTQTEIQIPELMPNDGEYYNLNGLRVETPSKGIYIKNGKKVVVK